MAGRPKTFKNSVIISTRIAFEELQELKELASVEAHHTGRVVTVQDLIRNAVRFVYQDNARLRECFRRSREIANKRMKRN